MNYKERYNLIEKIKIYIRFEDINVLKKLLDENKEICEPLYMIDFLGYSLIYDQFEVFEFLVDYSKFDVDGKHSDVAPKDTLLMQIVKNGKFNKNRILRVLKYSKNVNLIDEYGSTVLYTIIMSYSHFESKEDYCVRDRLDIIIELLKCGANINIHTYSNTREYENNLILDQVITREHFEILKLFMEHSKFDISNLALHIAISRGKYDFIEFLLNYMKDINKPIYERKTALQLAKEYPDEDIIELLQLWDSS